MSTPHTPSRPRPPKFNSVEGVALVIVLSCIVLLTALAIGLLNRVESDRANSSAYRGSTLTRNLAEYAINVVMAQISAATKSDPTLAWASQPGAIRTYSATGPNLVAIYKLYSSPEMVANAFPSSDLDLAGWNNNTALYTDLNAPVVSGSGPTARTNYPILDPRAANSVQGFAINSAPNTTPLQPAPMPVTWLYLLEDGTLAAPAGGTGNSVTVPGATTSNPIVSRIAFWTDDDTSKININTASGAPWGYTNSSFDVTTTRSPATTMPANYWDTPVIASLQDQNLAVSQPWGGEYQRYPGHPATASLSAIFTNLSTNEIMDIAPRITYQSGGSRWGSALNTGAAKLSDDASRLYANVDELLFATNRSASGTNPISPHVIEQARFFLTASSRAPDVTLFNTPRLLCWPVHTSATKQTPYDRLIAFCGSVGSYGYYFQRTDPYSPSTDYNLARNQSLMSYFRRMTTQAVPGFGGAAGILGKYNAFAPGESEQITTQIFDYIRCINLQDTSRGASLISPNYYSTNGLVVPTAGINGTRGFGRFPNVTKVGLIFWHDTNSVSGNVTNSHLCSRLLMETFIPAHGHPYFNHSIPPFSIEVSGLTNGGGFRWGSNSTSMTNIFNSDIATYKYTNSSDPRAYGGRRSIADFQSSSGAASTSSPPFSTNPMSALQFTGGNITIKTIYNGITNQVITNLNLPSITNLPIPLASANSTYNGSGAWSPSARLSKASRTIFSNDVVRSVQIASGDYRISAARTNSLDGSAFFTNHPNYFSATNSVDGANAHSFSHGFPYIYRGASIISNGYYASNSSVFFTNTTHGLNPWVNGDMITNGLTAYGDFDNGYGEAADGPYIGFSDEGNSVLSASGGNFTPYLAPGSQYDELGPGLYSPNRLVPSVGIIGSLPTGVIANRPWQTLLFRPASLTLPSHPGLATPPDYLLLDLYNMPVVEPYAISEPLSTAGRVNMNYQILPFTYIQRSTAVQAALHTEWLIAMKSSLSTNFNRKTLPSTAVNNSRFPLNLPATLQGFEARFAANDLFRSAAEICSIPLVPAGSTWAAVNDSTFWSTNTLTGDNSKERPYARIYPKLTTKSNTYTVHYRVEVLKKRPNSDAAIWTEAQDKVVSTYRGSTTIERYVNPRDPDLPDYASMTRLPPSGADALPNFYKFRILGERQFNP
jgi:uncharacterized protein (TIGR02600 family)